MYSAASELDIVQDMNSNGSIITKFSRTNRANKGAVNIRGISKNGKALVRQTVGEDGHVIQRNYALPEERVMELLTRANTHTLMGNLTQPGVKMIVKKKKSTTKLKRSATKKKSIKKKSKSIIKKKKSTIKRKKSRKSVKKLKKSMKKSARKHKKSINKDLKKLTKNVKKLEKKKSR